MKRFECERSGWDGWKFVEDIEGPWVKFSDVEPLIEALKKIRAYFDCLQCELAKGVVCESHLDERMEIADKALKQAGVG